MESIRVFVESIIYHNEDNYYSVLAASSEGKPVTVVGHFPFVGAGETIEAEGEFVLHPVYGEQFKAVSFRTAKPEGEEALIRYLGGGSIKGIGPKLARRIVGEFHEDSLRIIEEEPFTLSRVKGISVSMATALSSEVSSRKLTRDAYIFMEGLGIGPVLAGRIYERYGPFTVDLIKNEPYRAAEEIDGIGFRTMDRVAGKLGIEPGSPSRIRAGILYILSEAAADGHTYLPLSELHEKVSSLLSPEIPPLESFLTELQIAGRIKTVGSSPDEEVYFAAYYYAEEHIARLLSELSLHDETDADVFCARVRKLEETCSVIYDPQQKAAVEESQKNGFLVITGGPGTGKTTTINALIHFYEAEGMAVVLAAPTGRAAKRIYEATGHEAATVHRLLEYTGMPEKGASPGTVASYEGTFAGPGAAPYAGSGNAKGAGATMGRGRFLRDEKNPLEADVVIIDEASMIDIFLMEALLVAIVPGTRLILVGDADQLPSVGPGHVLKDIIDSKVFPVARLTDIHRQAAESDIVINAHKINRGETVDLSKKSRDFLFIRSDDPKEILSGMKLLLTEKLPGYIGCDTKDIEILSMTRIGELGTRNLNLKLKDYLNPASSFKKEKKIGDTVFREGDKVMQTRNDYELSWTVYGKGCLPTETGAGVFNGDIGYITSIDSENETLTVLFDETKEVIYDASHWQNLDLAYAATVHKSQGSEYPAVIMPMVRGPRLLMNRNLLYTAVTRAKKCVVLIGIPTVFEEMERNENENQRYSGLRDRISEVSGQSSRGPFSGA